jgi:hypothetical protein
MPMMAMTTRSSIRVNPRFFIVAIPPPYLPEIHCLRDSRHPASTAARPCRISVLPRIALIVEGVLEGRPALGGVHLVLVVGHPVLVVRPVLGNHPVLGSRPVLRGRVFDPFVAATAESLPESGFVVWESYSS